MNLLPDNTAKYAHNSLARRQTMRNGIVKAYALVEEDAIARTRTRGRVVRQSDIHSAVIASATMEYCVSKIGMSYEYEVCDPATDAGPSIRSLGVTIQHLSSSYSSSQARSVQGIVGA